MAIRLAGRCGYPADDPFRVTFHKNRLELPLKWKKPKRIFVNSMGDLFHPGVARGWLHCVFSVMKQCPHHTFIILTKRPERIMDLVESWPDHVWMGVTAENQTLLDERMLYLADVKARVRFVSIEPMLGPMDLSAALPYLGWVIVGGETGPGARYMKPEWAVNVMRHCWTYDVPFFFKQWGTANKQPPCGGLPREFPK